MSSCELRGSERSCDHPALVDRVADTGRSSELGEPASHRIGPRNHVIRRAPDEPSSDTPLVATRAPHAGPLPLARLSRPADSVPGANPARHALACSDRLELPPPAEASFSKPERLPSYRSHAAQRGNKPSQNLPRGRGPGTSCCLRTGFALKRLSPLHRPSLLRRSSTHTVSLGRTSHLAAFCEAFLEEIVHSLRSVVEARSRARAQVDRARRRPRFVPTDVCNPRDLFSTTSILASVHSEPLSTRLGDGPFTGPPAGKIRLRVTSSIVRCSRLLRRIPDVSAPERAASVHVESPPT